MLHQDVRMDFLIFVEQFKASWKQLGIATGCCGHEFFKVSKFLECLHPRIQETVQFDADTYEGIVQLAKMKSKKVKRKLELGMLKPADFVPVTTAERPVVQPRVAPYGQRVEPIELADCNQVADAQDWEIDKESKQSQDGSQVLVERQADEDADMESTYGDESDGSSSFWEASTEESLDTEFTSYSKETSFDEGELVRVKLPSCVHEDMMVCNVNEEQVKPGKEDMQIKVLCGTMLMTMLAKVVVEHAMVVQQVRRSSKKEEATLAMDEQQLDEAVVVELPCDADEVDSYWNVIETENDEARLNRDAETGHVQEEQVDEIAAYGVDCEDMVIEDAASVELSKDMADGPWDPEQVIFVEPEEEQAMDAEMGVPKGKILELLPEPHLNPLKKIKGTIKEEEEMEAMVVVEEE
ncbi:hypothetical protein L7F22_059901 [Adiantum nelumboides]|nr:hypothetical protein [Adiantum nelumboides]